MKVDLLYFDGCPYWQDALKNFKDALTAEGLSADINLVQISTNDQAARYQFLGSLSFQINGQDLWPEERNNYALSCRVYTTDVGMRGLPSVGMLRKKLSALNFRKEQMNKPNLYSEDYLCQT